MGEPVKDYLGIDDNPYKVLGVTTSAAEDEIKSAYKRLALQYHPDKNTNESSEDKIKALNKAYATLADVESRRLFDIKTGNVSTLKQQVYKMRSRSRTRNQSNITEPTLELTINSVYVKVPESDIELWTDEFTKKYEVEPIDRGSNGKQFKCMYTDSADEKIQSSLSITVYESKGSIHVQGLSCFLWQVNHFPSICKHITNLKMSKLMGGKCRSKSLPAPTNDTENRQGQMLSSTNNPDITTPDPEETLVKSINCDTETIAPVPILVDSEVDTIPSGCEKTSVKDMVEPSEVEKSKEVKELEKSTCMIENATTQVKSTTDASTQTAVVSGLNNNKDNQMDILSNKLSIVEGSVTDLLLDIKTCIKNASKAENTREELSSMEEKLTTLVTRSFSGLEKQMNRLTDNINKKMSDVIKRVESLEKVTHTDVNKNSDVRRAPVPSVSNQNSFGIEIVVDPKQTGSQESDEETASICSDSSDSDFGQKKRTESWNIVQGKSSNQKRAQSWNTEDKSSSQQQRDIENVDLLIIGNSNTRYINPGQMYKNKKVKKVTLRNKTVRGAKAYVRNFKPKENNTKVIAYLVGTNELEYMDASQIAEECKDLFNLTREKAPRAKIVLMGVPLRTGNAGVVEEANDALRIMCKVENVSFVENGNIREEHLNTTDGIHLTRAGLAILIRNLKEVVNPILGLKYTDFQTERRQPYTEHGRRQTFTVPERRQTYKDPEKRQPYTDTSLRQPERRSMYMDAERRSSHRQPELQQTYTEESERRSKYAEYERRPAYIEPDRRQKYAKESARRPSCTEEPERQQTYAEVTRNKQFDQGSQSSQICELSPTTNVNDTAEKSAMQIPNSTSNQVPKTLPPPNPYAHFMPNMHLQSQQMYPFTQQFNPWNYFPWMVNRS